MKNPPKEYYTNRVTLRPIPSVAAGAGPFDVFQPNLGSKNGLTAFPEENVRGVFFAPLDITPEGLAVRVHEYGHLAIKKNRLINNEIFKSDIDNGWVQTVLDVVVNSFLWKSDCREIKHLPLTVPPDSRDRASSAQIFLRAVHLRNEHELHKNVLPFLSWLDKLCLHIALYRLTKIGRAKGDQTRTVIAIARKLAERFKYSENNTTYMHVLALTMTGKTSDTSEELPNFSKSEGLDRIIDLLSKSNGVAQVLDHVVHGNQQQSITELLLDKFPQLTTRLTKEKEGRWGSMSESRLPLSKHRATKRAAIQWYPGYSGGVFRYPHRALLPSSDGACFGTRIKRIGGTILLDCSGSMRLKFADIQKLLLKTPLATIACYRGTTDSMNGSLAIVACKGQITPESELEGWFRRTDGGNVVDGPALIWLARQKGPLIWISDMLVTGVEDRRFEVLTIEATLLRKRYGIKNYESIEQYTNSLK